MTLPTVHEERTLNDHNALTNAPHAMSAVGRSLPQLAPWQSPAVMELAQNVGKGRPEASPMLIEGRTGTVLAAIGEERDHAIAGRALSSAMVQPKLIAAPTALGGGRGMQANQVQQQARAGGGGAIAASTGGGRLAAGNNRQRHGASFGAVYETAMAQASHILWRARRPCRKQHLRRISRRMRLCAISLRHLAPRLAVLRSCGLASAAARAGTKR